MPKKHTRTHKINRRKSPSNNQNFVETKKATFVLVNRKLYLFFPPKKLAYVCFPFWLFLMGGEIIWAASVYPFTNADRGPLVRCVWERGLAFPLNFEFWLLSSGFRKSMNPNLDRNFQPGWPGPSRNNNIESRNTLSLLWSKTIASCNTIIV